MLNKHKNAACILCINAFIIIKVERRKFNERSRVTQLTLHIELNTASIDRKQAQRKYREKHTHIDTFENNFVCTFFTRVQLLN